MDRGHRYTDKRIEALEKQLSRFYKGVSADIRERLRLFLQEHEDELNELWQRLENGEKVDVDAYIQNNLGDEIDEITKECVKADSKAMEMVGTAMSAIFIYNYNDKAETLNRKTGSKIKPIRKRKKRLLPPSTDKSKDTLWHRIKIRFVIHNAVRTGKSTKDVADSLETVTKMDERAAYRAARTALTNAENQGKLDAMYTLRDQYGIDCKKMWYATLDNRTRTSHREIHGEIQELEDKFTNGLMFPADPDGAPGEVWNCRCTLLEVINDIDIPESPKGMSREEWVKQKPKYKHYPKK